MIITASKVFKCGNLIMKICFFDNNNESIYLKKYIIIVMIILTICYFLINRYWKRNKMQLFKKFMHTMNDDVYNIIIHRNGYNFKFARDTCIITNN